MSSDIEPVRVSIELSIIADIASQLEDAKENAEDLLSSHDSALGRTTKKNLIVAKMYEKQIQDASETINSLDRWIK